MGRKLTLSFGRNYEKLLQVPTNIFKFITTFVQALAFSFREQQALHFTLLHRSSNIAIASTSRKRTRKNIIEELRMRKILSAALAQEDGRLQLLLESRCIHEAHDYTFGT